jgi:hypothetical protein
MKEPYRRIALFLLPALLAVYSLSAQSGQIRGRIVGPNIQPAEFATIALLAQDSTFVASALTNSQGRFVVSNIEAGTYFLQVDHIDFATRTLNDITLAEGQSLDLPDIAMEVEANALDEVLITKKKRMIEVQSDKIVFNVQNSPSASGTNGLDLLKMAPGVTVDFDNSISLLGKGNVQVYLNGVQSRLSGDDLVNFLQSLTSDTVENIEIISNPGARYEAEGTGGIINIRLKKSIATGFNGNATSSFTKGVEYRYSNNVSVNLGLGEVRANMDVTQSHSNDLEIFDDRKEQNNNEQFLYSQENAITDSWNVGMGLESQLGEDHYVGINARGIFNGIDNVLNSTTDIFTVNPPEYQSILFSQALADGDNANYLANAFHIWTLGERSSLSTNLSYGSYNSDRTTLQPNTYFEPDGTTVIRVDNTAFDTDTGIDLWSARLDYEKGWKGIALETGGKYASIKTQNNFSFFSFENGQPVFDPTRSNEFTYTEEVSALYANLNVTLSEAFSLNAGLRMEHTASRGLLESEVEVENRDVKRNYTDWFPNVGLSFDNQGDHAWSVNLGRRITRPNYQDLNPFEQPNSQLVVWKGNPFLNPNYVMNYQGSYSFKQQLIFTASYSVTTGFFARIIEITGDQSTQIIPRNMEKATTLAFSANYTFNLTDKWEVLIMANTNRQTYEGDVESALIDLDAWLWNYRIQNVIKLPWDILLDVTWSQNSRWIWRGSVFIDGYENLSFGIRKNFFDNKLQLRITGADVFRTNSDFPYTSDYGGIDLDGTYIGDNQRFGAGLTYNFGDSSNKAKKRAKNALDEELDRIQD